VLVSPVPPDCQDSFPISLCTGHLDSSGCLLHLHALCYDLVDRLGDSGIHLNFLVHYWHVLCEITAGQLEHPFGDDANDLPVLEFQLEMNRFLVTLLEPLSREVPELNDDAILDHAELAEAIGEECSMAWRSLSQAPNVYSHERPQLVKKSSALAPNMPERGLACDVEPEEMRADSRVKTEDPEPDLAADVDSSLCLQEQKNEKCRLDKDVSSFFPPKAQSSSSAPEGTLRILNM